MPTVAELYRDLGEELQDPANIKVETYRLLRFLNNALRDTVLETDCLWATTTITGLHSLTVVSYAGLAGDTVVVTIDGTANTLTAGADWTAATSNTATATSIATAINTISGAVAYSDGAIVYILADGGSTISATTGSDTTNITFSSAGINKFLLTSILTRYRQMRNLSDITNQVIYRSLTWQQWQMIALNTDYTGYDYVIAPDYYMYLLKGGGYATLSDSIVLDYLQYPTTLTLATESLPGVLNNQPEAVKRRALYYAFLSQGLYKEAEVQDSLYRRSLKQVRFNLRNQGEASPIHNFLQWH